MSYYSEMKIRKHKCGKWQGYMYYHDADGKRRQVSKLSKKPLKRDATSELREWANRLEAEAKRRGFIEHDKKGVKDSPTVEEMISGYLDYQLTTGKLEKSTYRTQAHNAHTRIYPYIGDYLFADLDTVAIESWITKLHSLGLSSNSIHTIYAIANKTYRHYHKLGQIPTNPFDYVDTPTKNGVRVTHLTDEGMVALLDAMNKEFKQGDAMHCAISLALFAGLRRGEICGLRWRDINLDLGILSVTSAVGIADGATYTKGPKNRSSYRTFPMIPQMREAIRHRYRSVEDSNGLVQDSWFVVGDTVRYMLPKTMGRRFKKFVDKYCLVDAYNKPITMHALRHNYASVGIRSKMDIASLSLMMGHASRSMTLDIYGDANADALLVAADKLGERFTQESDEG